jgi:hypothetical protein
MLYLPNSPLVARPKRFELLTPDSRLVPVSEIRTILSLRLLLRVKLRRTRREQMSSGLPLIADIDGSRTSAIDSKTLTRFNGHKTLIRSRAPFRRRGANLERPPRAALKTRRDSRAFDVS